MDQLQLRKPWAVQGPASPQLRRLAEEPSGAAQAARAVLRTIDFCQRWTTASHAQIIEAVREQLEAIATDRAGPIMRQLEDARARQ